MPLQLLFPDVFRCLLRAAPLSTPTRLAPSARPARGAAAGEAPATGRSRGAGTRRGGCGAACAGLWLQSLPQTGGSGRESQRRGGRERVEGSGGDESSPSPDRAGAAPPGGKKKLIIPIPKKMITPQQQPGGVVPVGLRILSWFVYFLRVCTENVINMWLLFSLPSNFPLPSSRPLIRTGLIRFGWLESWGCARRRGRLPWVVVRADGGLLKECAGSRTAARADGWRGGCSGCFLPDERPKDAGHLTHTIKKNKTPTQMNT